MHIGHEFNHHAQSDAVAAGRVLLAMMYRKATEQGYKMGLAQRGALKLKNMKTKKSGIVEKSKAKAKMEPWERREEETRQLLAVAKRKLPELKALLASTSDHWHYEDPIYRFYHHSFKVAFVQTTTMKIVQAMQSLAPHLKLNSDFIEIVAEGTRTQFASSRKTKPPNMPRAMIEAFFHAHHMLLMLCKYAEELPESPSVLPSGWATVLYLYNIR
jgi:hypothetical protein